MTAEQTVEMTVLGTDKGTLRFLCARPLDWARTHRNSLGLEGFLGKRACWFVLKQTSILSPGPPAATLPSPAEPVPPGSCRQRTARLRDGGGHERCLQSLCEYRMPQQNGRVSNWGYGTNVSRVAVVGAGAEG